MTRRPSLIRTTLSIAVCGVALAMAPPQAHGQRIGVQGGVNRAGISGDAPQNASYASAFGFMAGITFDLPLTTDVFLTFQPTYARRGTGIAYAIRGVKEARDSLDVTLTYVSVPLALKVEAARGRSYVVGGVDFGMLLDATLSGRGPEEDIASLVKDFDAAVLFGAGVVFPIGLPRINAELRYSQSVLNLAAGDQAAADAGLPQRFRAHGFQLLVGLFVPLGGR